MADNIRKIIHVDMDAFYASVEQRDFPEYRGKPLVVGGSPDGRGVVAAASYEVRRFGVHSAMPASKARRLCPQALFVKPRFDVYRKVSEQIRAIFFEFTHLVEPLSLDEAYLDVTENHIQLPSATLLAGKIRKCIKTQTRLTASAGVSYNKFLAKVASDLNKPDGLAVITPAEAAEFLEKLGIRDFHGIGAATEARMKSLGIKTGKDLKKWSEIDLIEAFGKAGRHYYRIVRGIDRREVKSHRRRKSYGKEQTFREDVNDMQWITDFLDQMAVKIASGMQKKQLSGKTITLKVRYDDFETITRSTSYSYHINDARAIGESARLLLEQTEVGNRKVRLLGITLSNLNQNKNGCFKQLEIPFEGMRGLGNEAVRG
jgi:DNA polymerase-4